MGKGRGGVTGGGEQDEEFHYNVTRQWCLGESGWHEKISTGPALYYYAYLIIQGIRTLPGEIEESLLEALQIDSLCSMPFFRFLMIPLSIVSFYIYILTSYHVPGSPSKAQAVRNGARMWFLPILFFYQFLFYNEVPSSLLVCWMYLLSQQNLHYLAALVRSRHQPQSS